MTRSSLATFNVRGQNIEARTASNMRGGGARARAGARPPRASHTLARPSLAGFIITLALIVSAASAFAPSSAARGASSFSPTALRVTFKTQGLTEDGHPVDAASDFGKATNTYAYTTGGIQLSEYDLQQCLATGECDLPEGVEMSGPPPPKRSLLARVFGRGNPRP